VANIQLLSGRKHFSLLTLLLSLTGCLGEIPSHNLAEAPKGVTPELQMAPKLAPYRLQVGDVVDVKLMLNPELNDQVVVRPDGMISTTVSGDILAYGRTVYAVRKDLEKGYGEHLAHPHVSLIVRSFAPTRVYVMGEVYSPGEFITVGPTLTMLQAIARSGGVKNSADTGNVVIVRHGEGDASEAFRASYHAAVTGGDPASDIRLAPYDIVYVPRSGQGNAYLNYQQDIQQFLPISGGVNYEINPTTTNR
jgi:polysaccharide export outer membrane protein